MLRLVTFKSLCITGLVLLAGCTGGSGGSDSRSPSISAAPSVSTGGKSASGGTPVGVDKICQQGRQAIEGSGSPRRSGKIERIDSEGNVLVDGVWYSTQGVAIFIGDHCGPLTGLAIGDTVTVVGNFDPQSGTGSTAAMLADVARTFVPTTSMNSARSGHAAALLADGKVLVVGGDASGVSAELFDPASATFVPTGSLTILRTVGNAVPLKTGKVLVTGISVSGPGFELYDPSTGTFSATGGLLEKRGAFTATLLTGGEVLIAGGAGGGGGGAATASAEVFNPETGTSRKVGNMISARANHTATLLGNGLVLIAGGWNGHRADAADDPPWDPYFAELFDPSSGNFQKTANMSTPRYDPVATRLPDGDVLILGGLGDLQNVHEQPTNPAYAEVYDHSSGSFRSLGIPPESRRQFAVTVVDDGRVMLVGGTGSSGPVDNVEFIDAADGRVIGGGHLTTARVGHTATRLKDGRVLVVGGTDVYGNALASAEIWANAD